MPRRRAFTLLEMMAVATTSAAVMGIVACSIHLLLRADRTLRDEMQHQAEISRLAEQFRDDVRHAERWSHDGAKNAWQFDLPEGEKVVYQTQSQSLDRRKANERGVAASELFRFPRGYEAAIELPSEGGEPIAVLRVRPVKSNQDAQPNAGIVIEAAVHREVSEEKREGEDE